MIKQRLLTLLAASAFLCPFILQGAIIADYEATIASPTDGGGGPELWYSNAGTASGDHMVNSGSTGGGTTNIVYRLATNTYEDFFGNANNAFNHEVTASGDSTAVASFSDAIPDWSDGTDTMLFNPAVSQTQALFSSGNDFELLLVSGNLRLETNGSTNVIGSYSVDTWYYFAASWDSTDNATADDTLTWYLGLAGGDTLTTGTIAISDTGVGAGTGLNISNRNPSLYRYDGALQEFAVWDRALSDQSIQDQYGALAVVPEPSTYAFIAGFVGLGLVMIRRRRLAEAG